MQKMTSVIENTPGSPVRRRHKNNFEPSPFRSERKRQLFPPGSPHRSDFGKIAPLSPVSSEFSPSKSKVVVRTPLVPTSANQNVTPRKSKIPSIQESPRRSPRIAEKQIIKTSSFYGRSLLSEFSKTTSSASSLDKKPIKEKENGLDLKKRSAPEPLQSNPSKKRCTSKTRSTSLFSGVGHSIKKPKPQLAPKYKNKVKTALRQSIKNSFDFTKTPYAVKKDDVTWNYAHIHREREDLEASESGKRKFFKSSVHKLSVITPPSSQKKRKLFKVKCDEILADPNQTASELLDMIEGNVPVDVSSNVCDLTESASNMSIDDAVEEAESPMIELLMNTPETPSQEPKTETEPDQESSQKVYPVFNFKKTTSKSTSPRKQGSARRGTKKVWRGAGENQLLIDAGQKQFGATQCSECGLMYEIGNAEDEFQHAEYHSYHRILRYPGYKNERIVGRDGLDYIVCFIDLDAKVNNKILAMLELVDKELGFPPDAVKVHSKSKVYFYISERRIVGCVVAESLSKAHKIGDESGVYTCSMETYKVKCGISRIWTLATHRRRGIATKMLDCVRRNFLYGSILAQEDIAFTAPTGDGKKFASKYTGKQDYYTYTGWRESNAN